MSQRKIFITGTDTDVGKTFFTAALISALQNDHQSVMAFKPVAAGCELIDGQLKNDDALILIKSMDQKVDYSAVNPIALTQPIAPHLSAKLDGVELSVKKIQQLCDFNHYQQDYILVEGAGGWLVPLNQTETLADYAVAESLAVILVVGLKLGCINHALLTQQSILQSGLKLVGWVANQIDPNMLNQAENIETLSQTLNSPLIAHIPYIDRQDENGLAQASSCVKISALQTGVAS